jgi:hypothetical protein
MSDRRVALLLILLGVAVSGLTVAVGEGLVTGVRAAWPAHLVGGVLVVIGLVGLRRPRDDEAPGRGAGGVRPNPRLWWSTTPRIHDPNEFRGGGEPNGRD